MSTPSARAGLRPNTRESSKPTSYQRSVLSGLDVRRADLAELHSKLSDRPYEANRALALVSAIWNWAARRDEVALTDNPAKGIERYPEKGRERFLTSEELSRLGAALSDGETIGLPYAIDEAKAKAKHAPKAENRRVRLDPFAVAAIRLLILTGARLREILDAQWSQVDLERGILFLRDRKRARSRSTSPPPLRPFSRACRLSRETLTSLPARRMAHPVPISTPWEAVPALGPQRLPAT